MSNYAAKSDLKIIAVVDTSKFAKDVALAGVKTNIDASDFEKFKTAHVELSKLSDVVKNEAFEKTLYGELVKKHNAIHKIVISDLAKKSDDNSKRKILKKNLQT